MTRYHVTYEDRNGATQTTRVTVDATHLTPAQARKRAMDAVHFGSAGRVVRSAVALPAPTTTEDPR
jgi:hypothetical protein